MEALYFHSIIFLMLVRSYMTFICVFYVIFVIVKQGIFLIRKEKLRGLFFMMCFTLVRSNRSFSSFFYDIGDS